MRIYKVKTIRALERGLEVLSFLQSSRAGSLHDLHRSTGLDKATLTRIIATLEKRGLIWQRLADGAFLPSQIVQERQPSLRDEDRLVEVASPILENLSKRVDWPSILAVPRLDHMEVLETNSSTSYFHHIPLGPIGFRVNMLRSATGRAYITFCSESERQAILARLIESSEPGNFLSRSPAAVERLLAETRELGYGVRFPDYGGDFNDSRGAVDDGRNSIAVPIFVGGDVIAAVNLTWINKVTTVDKIVKSYRGCLQDAAAQISHRLLSH
jgi:IclR family mhp operon transcriptional activator